MGSTTSYLAFIIRNLFFDFEFREVLLTNRKYSHESYLQLDNIIEEPDKKRDIAINKKNKALLKDEVSIYRLEENTLDYILFIICELTGNKLYNIKIKEKIDLLIYSPSNSHCRF